MSGYSQLTASTHCQPSTDALLCVCSRWHVCVRATAYVPSLCSCYSMPMVFILSPGADPQNDIQMLGDELGFTGPKFKFIALGQGQGPLAEQMLVRGHMSQQWVATVQYVTGWPIGGPSPSPSDRADASKRRPHVTAVTCWWGGRVADRLRSHHPPTLVQSSAEPSPDQWLTANVCVAVAGNGLPARSLGAAAELPPAHVVAEAIGEDAGADEDAAPRLPPMDDHRALGPVPARHPAAVTQGEEREEEEVVVGHEISRDQVKKQQWLVAVEGWWTCSGRSR